MELSSSTPSASQATPWICGRAFYERFIRQRDSVDFGSATSKVGGRRPASKVGKRIRCWRTVSVRYSEHFLVAWPGRTVVAGDPPTVRHGVRYGSPMAAQPTAQILCPECISRVDLPSSIFLPEIFCLRQNPSGNRGSKQERCVFSVPSKTLSQRRGRIRMPQSLPPYSADPFQFPGFLGSPTAS